MDDTTAIMERLAKVEARASSNTHRIESVEHDQKALQSLATSVEVMATKQASMGEKIDRIDAAVDTLSAKSGKRWDGLMDKLIYAAVGAFFAWVATGMPGVK